MKTFKFNVQQTDRGTVTVEANSLEEAEREVQEKLENNNVDWYKSNADVSLDIPL